MMAHPRRLSGLAAAPGGQGAQPAQGDPDDVVAEIDHHCDQGAEVDRHVQFQPLVGEAEQMRRQDQVAGTGDGQELGQTLDQCQDRYLQEIHGSNLGR